jgi:TolB-like protein
LPEKPSVAVLPFSNLSGDPQQEYFADGMVDDIITGLARINWLFVIARNSTFSYKGRAVNVKQVGRELGVRYVLEGSVRKAGRNVRVTGQMIDASTGVHVWAERYDRSSEDIFALQDEIALSAVGAIAPSVRKAEIERVRRKPMSHLLRGRYEEACRAAYRSVQTIRHTASLMCNWPLHWPNSGGWTKPGRPLRVCSSFSRPFATAASSRE